MNICKKQGTKVAYENNWVKYLIHKYMHKHTKRGFEELH